jgi:predicted dehydrogenase
VAAPPEEPIMDPRQDRQRVAVSRRRFLRTAVAGAVAAPFVLPSGLWGASPNSRLCHACIGVTRMGHNDLMNFRQHEKVQIVALCDVDTQHLDAGAKLVPGARLYTDWRELFEKEGDKIDAVNVTTPDHMHFPIAYTAVRRGTHLYCQKPMCHDLAEVRMLTEAAVRAGIVTQLGTQFASSIAERMTVQLIRSGAIGKIKHVYLCSNREAPNRVRGPRPPKGEEPPPHLKWDLWIGTAPMRPYAPDTYHPAKWRGWLDFGTSWCADMGCHILDATWRGLGLKAPTTVEAEVEESWKNSPERRADNWPQSEHVTWTFPGNDRIEGPELAVEWFDGAMLPPREARDLNPTGKYPLEAALLVGTEGAILHQHGTGPQLLPKEKYRTYERPKPSPRDHYRHFVDACLGGEQTEANFAQTGPMTEAILLGTVAIRCFGLRLKWDASAMKFSDNPDAQRYLKRHYRDGWQVSVICTPQEMLQQGNEHA